VLAGQALRSMAMIQASTNFSHMVAHQKVVGHRLVKEGVYAYVPRSGPTPPECVLTFDSQVV
jgi:protein-S-isoprenylcysteine O-methyltransferase Ste14